MIKAARLAPIEKAERRVLALANPGLGLENMQATPSIFIGLQLIMPGETAPEPSAQPERGTHGDRRRGWLTPSCRARNARWKRAI